MTRERIKIVWLIFTLLIFVLLIRTGYFQVFAGSKLSRAASAQRSISTEIEKSRGNIYDRNLIPFTNRNKITYIILKPQLLREKSGEITNICQTLDADYWQIKEQVETMTAPIVIETGEEKAEELLKAGYPGVSVVHSLKRYDDSSIARHVLDPAIGNRCN